MPRVIVSSMGAISAAGNNLKENLETLKLGKIIATFESPNEEYPNEIFSSL